MKYHLVAVSKKNILNVKLSLLKHSVVVKPLKFFISLLPVSTEKYTIIFFLSITASEI